MLSIKDPFPAKADDERIILFVRKHWWAFFGFLLVGIVMFLIPILLYFVLLATTEFGEVVRNYYIVGSSIFWLFAIHFLLVAFIDWYFDIVILTDRRLLDIHQEGLFNRQVDELDLLRIEDVRAEMRGFWGSMLRFGNVSVQTAGTAPNFLFRTIPHSTHMARQIMSTCEEHVRRESGQSNMVRRLRGVETNHRAWHPPKNNFQGEKPDSHDSSKEGSKSELSFDSKSDFETSSKPVDSSKEPPKVSPPSPNTERELKEGEEVDIQKDSNSDQE